ncbi:MAG: hypothetical protein LBI11_01000 [Streptococcaceae bacterium]|jgi:hypothetical protein|nr:hypothetical protein [Streptococcaceae bacterium]
MKYLVLLGAAISLFSACQYAILTVRGRVMPNRVTWFLWSLAPIVASVAAISSGVTWAALPVFMAGFSPFIIFLASFSGAQRKNHWKITRFDWICGAASLLAFFVFLSTKDAILAIWLSMAADFLAAVPTFRKAWKFPETESAVPFTLGLFATATTFFAIEHWNFESLAFSIYVIGMNVCLSAVILGRKRHEKA